MNPPELNALREDVTLRDLQLEHAPAMYRWVSDPFVSENIGLRTEPSLPATQAWIRTALEDPRTVPFAIFLSEQHVGNVILDRLDFVLNTARLSIYIDASARQQGVGFTASYLALDEGFTRLSLYKVWLTVHARHVRAIGMYTALGFSLEGILRGEFLLNGKRIPVLHMGILGQEFRESKPHR